ncbi:glycosyltransferase [Aurantimonas litoralis]|nr:glycosyltransferase [Aurantimonas litoralis]
MSIVIAARNAERFLGDAVASVEPGLDCEILLADGGSTDATLTIAARDPRLRIVSRSDGGIYDGMNRGIAAATGDAVLLLNSDDLLPPGAVEAALLRLRADTSAGWVSGTALFGEELASAVERTHRSPLSAEGALFGVPAINARLFRRDLLHGIGPIRTDLGLASDREFLARVARSGRRGLALGTPLYFYRVHEGSRTISGDRSSFARVHRAEEMLSEGLLTSNEDTELQRLAAASGTVASLKRGLRGRDVSVVMGALSRPAQITRGARLSLRWRGQLSGY